VSDVYVVGSLNADHRVRVSRIPKAGETILGSEIVVSAGGKGANQAVAVSRAGAAATMIGAAGADPDGDIVRNALARQGVDTQHVHVVRGARTGGALINVDDHGANTIVVSPGANAQLTDEDVSAGLRSMGAEHDDANAIAMGAWVIGRATAAEVLEAFLNASFDNDDDTIRRVGKLHELERSSARELAGEI
jgi:sugar/nucleoside kinase (ribokinase family)